MDNQQIQDLGDELYRALRDRTTVSPLTTRVPEITTPDAYLISRRIIDRRVADGETIIGKKIGVTSLAVQRMLDVHTPDFGWLTDRMRYEEGASIPISELMIQPRAEAEIAFVLAKQLRGPSVTPEDVVDATREIFPCFEIVDSRVAEWKIRYEDTVSDNASSGVFLMGSKGRDPRGFDFEGCTMTVEKNGAPLSSGKGTEAIGSPIGCVAWLANKLAEFDIALEPGEIILSGSLVPLEPVVAGDRMTMHVPDLGSASVVFT